MFNPNETYKKINIVQTLEQVAWGGCEVSIIGGIQKPSTCVCGHHAVADPALNRRIGLNDSQWSLWTSAILWFCDFSVQVKQKWEQHLIQWYMFWVSFHNYGIIPGEPCTWHYLLFGFKVYTRHGGAIFSIIKKSYFSVGKTDVSRLISLVHNPSQKK